MPPGGPDMPPPSVKIVVTDEISKAVFEGVEYFHKAEMGNKVLKRTLHSVGAKGDERGVRTLIALTEDWPRFRIGAIEGLGLVTNPATRLMAAATVKAKLDDRDPQMACAAVQSYATVMGDEGIPEVQRYLRDRFARPDGYEVITTSGGAKALGSLKTLKAAEALAAELARAPERTWLPDYGSAVVEAIKETERHEVVPALAQYMEALRNKMPPPSANDPIGRQYYSEKIQEAHNAIQAIVNAAARKLPPGTEIPPEMLMQLPPGITVPPLPPRR